MDRKKVVEQEGARDASPDMSSAPLPTEDPNVRDMMEVENTAKSGDISAACNAMRETLGLESISDAHSSIDQREITLCAQLDSILRLLRNGRLCISGLTFSSW